MRILYTGNEIIFKTLKDYENRNNINYMYDQDFNNVVKFEHKYMGKHIEDLTYAYLHDPYGYKINMRIVTNVDELMEAIEQDPRDIFIDGNIYHSRVARLRGPVDGHTNLIQRISNNIDPDVFKTWRIGPRCKTLNELFYKYKHNPNISHWCLDHLLDCSQLFMDSGVTDLSHLSFYQCRRGVNMFTNCKKLTNLPEFHELILAYSMCEKCIMLEDADDAFVHCHGLRSLTKTFAGCKNLRYALNNCTITVDHDIQINNTFDGCELLIDVLNNCDFNAPRLELGNTFENCNYIISALCNLSLHVNECIINNTFFKCKRIDNALNNCDFYTDEYENPIISFESTFKYCDDIYNACNNNRFETGEFVVTKILDRCDNVKKFFNNNTLDVCSYEQYKFAHRTSMINKMFVGNIFVNIDIHNKFMKYVENLLQLADDSFSMEILTRLNIRVDFERDEQEYEGDEEEEYEGDEEENVELRELAKQHVPFELLFLTRPGVYR